MAEKIATRKAYGEALVEYAEEYPEINFHRGSLKWVLPNAICRVWLREWPLAV